MKPDPVRSAAPKISVCMPVFNGEEFLPESIASILSQTRTDFELIIADDCSTDGSWQVIEHYAQQDSRIRAWRNEKNLGLFANWNLTMKEARGNFIKPFAQDDFCRPEFLEKLAEVLETQTDVSLVGSARSYFNGRELYAVEPDARKYYRDQLIDGKAVALKFLLDGENLVGFPPAMMFRKEHLGNGFNEEYFHCGDVEFFIRLLMKGDYYFLHKPLVTYRYHGQNQTYKNFAELKFMSDLLLLKRDYTTFVREQGHDDFEEITGEQLASVVAVGRKVLGIDYAQIKAAPELIEEGKFVEIIVALADRVDALKAQQAKAPLPGQTAPEMGRLAAERDELLQANHKLHQQLHGLVTSTSWKLTRPIRMVKRLVSRTRH